MAYIKDEVMVIVMDWLDAYCRSDLTKRQTQIMALLLTLTLRQGGIHCHMPHLSDFEQCGISRTKVRAELEKLESMNVIMWDREEMIFYMNPHTSEWKAPVFKKFDENRYNYLVELNQSHENGTLSVQESK